ncbi:tetraspanin-9-like isoform X2 [Ischnura elegans]|uniref:tetraspanin-9-like isoform X2 n=1 Tax=Ischnura elegans TaxID=197161 RepID=UPI001ED882A4|nr:tetraspanin-9-like isoform X2 [Ischnura elegans]
MNALGKCIRSFLMLYNLIIMGAGFGAIVVIVWMIIGRSFLGKLIGIHMYIGLLYMLLTASFLVVFISFFGCYGAANSLKWMLYAYGGVLSILFLLVFIASMMGLLVRDWISRMIHSSLLQSLNLYSKNKDIKQAWDEIQSYFRCCGVNSYQDWNGKIPSSCCQTIKFILIVCAGFSFALATLIIRDEILEERDINENNVRMKRR